MAVGRADDLRQADAAGLWAIEPRSSQVSARERRRQTSSRLATFAEAFSSIGWAATAALALALPVVALVSGLMTIAIIAAAWKLSPKRA